MSKGGLSRYLAVRLHWEEAFSLCLVVLFVAVVATGVLPLGIPGQWVWPCRLVPLFGGLAALAVFGTLSGVGLSLLLLRRPPRSSWACGFSLWAVAFLVRLLLFHSEPLPILKQVWTAASTVSNTFFSEALRAGPSLNFIREYVHLLPQFSERARTHPPGPVLYYKAFLWPCRKSEALLEGSKLWAQGVGGPSLSELAIIVGARTGLPLEESSVAAALWAQLGLCLMSALLAVVCFCAGLSLGVEKRAALGASALFALSPSAVLFSVTINTIVALLCGLSLLFVLKGREESSPEKASLLIGGLLLYLATFTSLSAIAMGAVLSTLLLLRHGLRRGLASLSWLLFGFALTYAAVRLIFGFDLYAVTSHGLSAHKEVTTAFKRSYLAWLLINPVEFAAFCGLPIIVLAGLGWREERTRPLILSSLATFALLDISGFVRGEVARIWLFLLPPLCVASGAGLIKSKWPSLHLLLLAFQTASLKIWLDPVRPF